jgi:arylformamidase
VKTESNISNPNKFIDITYEMSPNLPVWPDSIGFTTKWHMTMPERNNNLSSIEVDTHFGTHLDAPLHFIENGKAVNDIELDKLIGMCYLVSIRNTRSITSAHLEMANIPKECNKLLLKTDNQLYWENGIKTFQKDFCSIDETGAQWIVDNNIHLVGIDYLSIQRFYDGPETHQILLRNEVVIVESVNLEKAVQGWYELICLPLNIQGLEGSPVRAVLKKIGNYGNT